jgi:hypothetical protein
MSNFILLSFYPLKKENKCKRLTVRVETKMPFPIDAKKLFHAKMG